MQRKAGHLVGAQSKALTARAQMTMEEQRATLEEFWQVCVMMRTDYDLYRSLFEADEYQLDLFTSVAPLCFGDLSRILVEHLLLQFSKITDPARTGRKYNLTTNYILEELPWPDEVRTRLSEVNERLRAFRDYIESARSKRIAHLDLPAQIERHENLGRFPKGADIKFLQDLQLFIDIAYGHLHDGERRPIAIGMSTDTPGLIRAL